MKASPVRMVILTPLSGQALLEVRLLSILTRCPCRDSRRDDCRMILTVR